MHLPAGYYTFKTPADFFASLRGPADHDAHVVTRRHYLHAVEMRAASARAVEAMRAEAAAINERERERQAQRVAADFNYNTAAIRGALHRWQYGCFSTRNDPAYRAARIRQLTRALDIAIAHHNPMATAAE
jgi:hypothetical protein